MKSMINEAKMTKRYNTGDYEFEEYTLGAVVDERESGVQVLKELKLQINEAFVGKAATPAAEKEETVTEKPKKKEKKNAKPTKASVIDDETNDDEDSSDADAESYGESTEDDEASDTENGDDSDDSSDESEEDAKPAAKAAKGKKSDEEKPSKKKFVKKPQTYNRGIEEHKQIFGRLIRSLSPDFNKSDKLKQLVKDVSLEMEGEDFLEENGEVVSTFDAAVKKLMKAKK